MAPSLSEPVLIKEVMHAIRTVDEFVMRSRHIRKDVLALEEEEDLPIHFDYSDPEANFENLDALGFWEDYFGHIIVEWEEFCNSTGTMSEARLNYIVELLNYPASVLDEYGPQLLEIYQNFEIVPVGRVQGILRRRVALNGFLNSVQIGLENWWWRQDLTHERTHRRRRPMPYEDGEQESEEETKSERKPYAFTERWTWETPQSIRSLVELFREAKLMLPTNAILITLTCIVVIAAGKLQWHAYDLATQRGNHVRGKIDDPDFYASLQNFMMQILGLVVTLLPAVRHTSVRQSFTEWTWVIALLRLLFATLSVEFYFHSSAFAQLFGFIGTAMQAAIMLQLINYVDETEARVEWSL